MSAAEWEAWCDATAEDDEPPAPGDGEVEEPDPELGTWVGDASGFAAGNVLDALPGGNRVQLAASVKNRKASPFTAKMKEAEEQGEGDLPVEK